MTKTLYLGIDVSMAKNTCCPLLHDSTEIRRRFTVPNNLPGAEQLVEDNSLVSPKASFNIPHFIKPVKHNFWKNLPVTMQVFYPDSIGEFLCFLKVVDFQKGIVV